MISMNYVPAHDHRRLNIREITRTERREPGAVQLFHPDQIVYREGERASAIFQVETGGVRVFRIMPSGHRHILAFHVRGEWFGLQADDTREDFAEAICDSRLRVVSMDEASALPVNLLTIALANLSTAHNRQLVMVRQSAVARVAAFIEEIAGRHTLSTEFELQMSRKDIADYLGMAVESVARSFSKLSSRRIIRLDGHSNRVVRILDRAKLEELSLCRCRRDPFF
jgi:CRP/FNR family transcriptional regulator/CRP/FNR family nitrogen fixation transcriptional regulator